MKKIISLVVFIAALVWTWNVVHTTEAIGFETHSGIQERLAELIKNTLAAKKPNAKDLSIMRLWTEPMNDNKVRAVFAYKFTEVSAEEGEIEQLIEGEAILHREAAPNAETDTWTLQSVKTTNDIVTFTDGTTLTPEPEAPPATEAAPGTTAPAETGTAPMTPTAPQKTESH
ncbi:hypothetical protein D3C72_966050 [compost metagenome]